MNATTQSVLLPQRPLTILVAALGGEGGGRLADWLVATARYCDYPVQSISIPGVAQRTGATTYYIEIYPMTTAQLGGRQPIMALTPTPGAVDVVVASELSEAARALQSGYVTATTTLIASTHRVYTVAEKSVPLDGRASSEKMIAALKEGAGRALLLDMAQAAVQHAAMINAVLFGALAGSGALPLARAACESAIREAGKGADASLRGFTAGYDQAAYDQGTVAPVACTIAVAPEVPRVRQRFPAETVAVLEAGVARLIDYQDRAYADLYLDRMEPILTIDREAGGADQGYRLTRETGRLLALWMSYEDLIRVADLKTRESRFERLRAESGAGPDDVVTATEYFKPGIDELCAVLPQGFAQRLRLWAARNGKESLSVAMQIKTTSLRGFLLLRAFSGLRRWRRQSSRYEAEHKLMERWLGAIKRLGFAVLDVELALEIAECARLVKGYGETHRNGVIQFEKIFNTIIESGTESDPKKLAAAIARARAAALGRPGGTAAPASKNADPGKPIFWMPRKSTDNSADKNSDSRTACSR